MSNPCHIEVIVSEAEEPVAKAVDDSKLVVKLSAKQRARSFAEQRRLGA